MPEGSSLALNGLLFSIYDLTVPADWRNSRDVIPSTAAVPGRGSSSRQLTQKMVQALSCWPGAATPLFNVGFLVLAVQQVQPSCVEPPEGGALRGWEEQAFPTPEGRGSPVPLQDRLHSLAEAQRLLDELTREKTQVGSVQCDRAAHHTPSGLHMAHSLFCLMTEDSESCSFPHHRMVPVLVCRSRRL